VAVKEEEEEEEEAQHSSGSLSNYSYPYRLGEERGGEERRVVGGRGGLIYRIPMQGMNNHPIQH